MKLAIIFMVGFFFGAAAWAALIILLKERRDV